MKSIAIGALALVSTLAVETGTAFAASKTQQTEYNIAIAGIPVARAVFNTKLEKTRYAITGSVNTAGLADLIADIRAKTSVHGAFQHDSLRARKYELIYTSGKRTRTYTVNFSGSRVSSTSISPEPKRPEGWVPVTSRQLSQVLDPISGLIFPEGRKVCPRSLPIFDGETRMDLVLSPKGTRSFKAKGYEGDVLVCSVRFVPKAGYRKGRKDIEYLRNSSKMEIWFGNAGELGLVAPVYVSIPTQIGMLTISASKISN